FRFFLKLLEGFIKEKSHGLDHGEHFMPQMNFSIRDRSFEAADAMKRIRFVSIGHPSHIQFRTAEAMGTLNHFPDQKIIKRDGPQFRIGKRSCRLKICMSPIAKCDEISQEFIGAGVQKKTHDESAIRTLPGQSKSGFKIVSTQTT